MNGTLLLLAAILTPLLATLPLLEPRARRAMLHLAPLAALPALILALSGSPEPLALPWFFLGAELSLDATGRVFLLLSAWLWLIAAWFSGGHLASAPKAHYFLFFFFLAQAGNFGLILAGDLITFNVFFTLMGLAAYGLVVHRRDPAALKAGRVYLSMVLLGEVLIFVALIGLVFQAGGLTGIPTGGARELTAPFLGCLLLGFGIKAGLVPLHFWLPLAHPAAPVPASSVLSGTMIKAGLLGWLRFLPGGEITLTNWGLLCLLLGFIALFYGVLRGLASDNPKTVLAWSSVSQMGLITTGLGLGLAVPAAYPAALAAIQTLALHHGLAKGALFLSVAVVAKMATASTPQFWSPPSKMGTVLFFPFWPSPGGRNGRQNKAVPVLLAILLLLPALALAGAPLTSGFLAKNQLMAAAEAAWPLLPAGGSTLTLWQPRIFSLLLSLGSLATALLLLRFLSLLWRQGEAARNEPAAHGAPPPWQLLLPWGLLVCSGLLLAWLPAAWLPESSLPTQERVGWSQSLVALAPILVALVMVRLRPAILLPRLQPTAVARRSALLDLANRLRPWLLGNFSGEQFGAYRQRFYYVIWEPLWHYLEQRCASWPLAGCSCLLLLLAILLALRS